MVLKEIIKALNILERLLEKRNEIPKNEFLQGALLWYLYVAVQGSIDLALKIISELNLGVPETYAEAIEILNAQNLISDKLKERLLNMVKFRHLLAHAYPAIQLERILDEIDHDISDIKMYLRELSLNIKRFNKKLEDF